MADNYYSATTITLTTVPNTTTVTHGIVVNGAATTPDLVYVEFQGDPTSTGRAWTSSKNATTAVIGYDGTSNPTSAIVHCWYVHSIQR